MTRLWEAREVAMRKGFTCTFTVLVVAMAGLSAVAAAADVTQARYMTQSQFLHSLKQVSLTLHVIGDPLKADLSVDQARDFVKNALANSGIAVRPNSPVASK